MQLLTSEIQQKLQAQYSSNNELERQQVVCKIFNPYGHGSWYLLNQDPEDPDYLWAIVSSFEVEIGGVLKSELEGTRITPAKLPLERDLYFEPINAKEAYDRLLKGEHL